ncbi:M24 family metallopeptidase [Vampirovibrio sp.]|uniref:M24 family metallopeptidase n=1 Tax=Vampirovibrio sp. TaxID=2717857 RepID=UPI003593DF16
MPPTNTDTLKALIQAETKAEALFHAVESQGLICPGLTEREISDKVYELAFKLFGIRKYWHKRIVRAGENTLLPYRHNPENLTVQEDDIVFLDFGPVFDDWEADYGRTYVLGDDPLKHKLNNDLEIIFKRAQRFFIEHCGQVTGSQLYQYACQLSSEHGWVYGGPYAGHLVGQFPHEKILGDDALHYIHPENHTLMSNPDQFGNPRHWILEIHLVDKERRFGGFFEQLLLNHKG